MPSNVRIALAQIGIDADPHKNLVKALALMDEAASRGAGLIVFPESQFAPYFPQYPNRDASRYLVKIDDPLIEAMQRKCRERGLVATANVYLSEDDRRYSATILIDDEGNLLGASKKMHITCVPQFYEQHYFDPSDEGFQVYDTAIGKVGVVICYDRHYPESIRACALRGADLILIPTANTFAENMQMFEWEMRVSAFQNTVFVAMCNRVGVEDAMTFAGESLVADPNGGLAAKGNDREGLLLADLDYALIDESRAQRPYLSLRNPRLTADDRRRSAVGSRQSR
jgi:N-carbamoylputrescine amidase